MRPPGSAAVNLKDLCVCPHHTMRCGGGGNVSLDGTAFSTAVNVEVTCRGSNSPQQTQQQKQQQNQQQPPTEAATVLDRSSNRDSNSRPEPVRLLLPACAFVLPLRTGQAATIRLTAHVSGAGPSSACTFIDANPAPAPGCPNTLDTILILRLEDGADVFVSLRGTFLPSCYGMDLDR